ncbi:hypothetical protein CIW49_28270 [Mycolicibacterium sp. P1-18]|uniref:hypothetical protein n=1 Tax=Mycolicibacterium sp. P1-18 TaxID=2024615 RepID=UPI0011F11B3F|nr:hypothetical protein [Mycolicibacterium sp. P1-18]KAA0092698.1 hypothetical protein CIW49_28270 [Mycolicibacterium sp. P1-18]
MGLFRRASVVVTPEVVTPRQTVQVTVTTDEPVRDVRSARLDWGYVNFYQYHWAGGEQTGASPGGDRDTDDWVSVVVEDLPIAVGEFTGATSSFRIPSWAPASAPAIARWECRLSVDRAGRDVEARGEFTVKIGTADVESYVEPLEHVSGAADTVVDLSLTKPVWRAGETVTGHVTLTPTTDLPDGDLAVSWQRERDSHPLTRTPGPGGQLDGRIIQLDKRVQLRAGTPVTLAFELDLPDDAAPTAAAVHSSINWYVQARLTYAGFTGHALERVRRPITVVNAP